LTKKFRVGYLEPVRKTLTLSQKAQNWICATTSLWILISSTTGQIDGLEGCGRQRAMVAGESMKPFLESPENTAVDRNPPENGNGDRWTVLQELDDILSSRHFNRAERSKQFLRYVVLSKLDGHTDKLKERTIGTEVFRRPPGYATGEDPVVRVQAGEVRRRLEQYYQEMPQPSPLRIELPVGSYAPVFCRGAASRPAEPQTQPATQDAPSRSSRKLYVTVASLLAVAILAVFGGRTLINSLHRIADPKTKLEQFWGPAIASHQPILICLSNERDNPSEVMAQRALEAPSGISQSKAVGIEPPLPPDPVEKVASGDDSLFPEIVPAADASVAAALSGLFGSLEKPSQLRIGAAATYEDLRSFPAAVIGGFDSRWTLQLVSKLHFAFLWNQGQYMIREQVPGGRAWTTRLGLHGETLEDFAIVGRLVDSKTGQFTVTVAGIGPRGTQAAGEFVSSTRYLEEGLAKAPRDWQNRNLEVLLQTTVTDSVAGPPHVIATYSW
jgi:hypothetical protein